MTVQQAAPEPTYRLAVREDAPAIRNLIVKSFRAFDDRPNWTGHRELATSFDLDVEMIEAALDDPDKVILVGEMKGKDTVEDPPMVATVQLAVRPDGDNDKKRKGRLILLAVDPEHQQGGVGRKLVELGEGYCWRTWQTDKIGLNALSTRPALIEWYERRGYVRTGETTAFPQHLHAGVDLPEDICVVELEKTTRRV